MTADSLVLGPLLRHVGETTATIWVETATTAMVTVTCGQVQAQTRTFAAHGHHYAIVLLEGLAPGSVTTYQVSIDGQQVWPDPDSTFPPSRIATLDRNKPTFFAFGSCRTSAPHDAQGTKTNGVDAMRAYAYDMAKGEGEWPDFILFLGDQLYADETLPQMRDFIQQRRGLQDPPGEEVKDFVEYAKLYDLAWSDPANRWLLSTLSSAMIFDDHDVRDDWNTSSSWHEEMNRLPWWHDRIVGALASYWIYQHAGNLSPELLREDEIYAQIAAHETSGAAAELDLTQVLDEFGARVDRHPTTYRFSFTRHLGDSELIVIDSRAARELTPGERAMLDPDELAWLDERMRGDVHHLFIGTSLPFLLPPAIHDLEGLNETMAQNVYGTRVGAIGEKIRRAVDLEHWAAFERSFQAVAQQVIEVARGERGAAPETITFLSGDVHNSYVNEVPDGELGTTSRIIQAVCSPIRNPLPMHVRALQGKLSDWGKRPMRALVSRMTKVAQPPFSWATTHGPWFDNNLAAVQVTADGLLFTWDKGVVEDGHYDDPQLERVSTVRIDSATATRATATRATTSDDNQPSVDNQSPGR